MKATFKVWADRIDAATLRERVLIFLALALVGVFIANALLIEPLRTREKAIAAETQKLQTELRGLETGLQRLVQGSAADPDAVTRKKVADARTELAQINARIVQEQRRFTPPERMRAVLQELFERNKGLTMVELKSLPVQPLAPAGGAAGLFRHGIELSVSGGYADLYEYLKGLESLPTQLYWGRAELLVAGHPRIVLKLTVYTASFDRAWLTV
jgi:MSHA biogenesis protein MshJ